MVVDTDFLINTSYYIAGLSMATIYYQGLTDVGANLTVNLAATTFSTLIANIASAEQLYANYYAASLENSLTINSLLYPTDTFTQLGITDNSMIICTTYSDGLTKEQRQLQKLDIAQSKRQNDIGGNDPTAVYYRAGNVYDITSLPDVYNANIAGPDDNPNTGGLIPGRPWLSTIPQSAPETLAEALPPAVLVELESWYDGSDLEYYVPKYPADGNTFTQWTDKSSFAHNANPIGGATFRPTYQANELNSLGVVRFDGNDGLSINPYASLASDPHLTVFVVAKMTATTGNPHIVALNVANDLNLYYDSTAGRWTLSGAQGIGQSTIANDASAFHIHTIAYNGANANNATRLRYRYDKSADTLTFTGTVGTTLSASSDIMYVGNNNGANYYTGDIAEFLVFTRVLTDTQIQNVENYLSTKWGL